MNIFSSNQSPVYIYTHDFRDSSAGIRCLHYLCHMLNELGMNAYLTGGRITSPKLRTPLLTPEIYREHFLQGLVPIAIYPEVVSGNPLGAPIVFRWLLNKPGKVGGDGQFEQHDQIYYHEAWCLPDNVSGSPLMIPSIDRSVFHPDTSDQPRSDPCYYANKYLINGGKIQPEHLLYTSLCHNIRRSKEEIADILRTSDGLYCYEPSALITEAIACGCPVYLVPSDYWPLDRLEHDEHLALPGVAVVGKRGEPAQIQVPMDQVEALLASREEQAWHHVHALMSHIGRMRSEFHPIAAAGESMAKHDLAALWYLPPDSRTSAIKQVDKILESSHPLQLAIQGSVISSSAADTLSKHYSLFRASTSLQEIDGELLAERMMTKWSHRPAFNVVVELEPDEAAALAITIDSLAAQWYPHWHLTIFAQTPPSPPELADIPRISWITLAADASDDERLQAINTTLAQQPEDWIAFIEPGITLEQHAMVTLANTINHDAQGLLLYCDEDYRDEEGDDESFVDPFFKPDINLERLRNQAYLGPFACVKLDAFLTVGGLCHAGRSGLLDITFKLIENYSATAIVHHAEFLAHLDKNAARKLPIEAQQAVVEAHLGRCGVDASVAPGQWLNTLIVNYEYRVEKVSIIVPFKDQPGHLYHCVESLLEETVYPNYELILVDHASQDPDTLDFITGLAKRPEMQGRLKYTRYEGDFNYAKLCNLGAALASGSLLLFIDNDTEFTQAAWLQMLVAHAQQPGVAAVGPRMASPEGDVPALNHLPRILGLHDLADGIAPSGTSVLSPGDHGQLHINQDVSALAGSCFMVKTEAFLAAGRFDEINTPIFEPVLHLCLRLSKLGQRLIWTPWSLVSHRDGVSLKPQERDPRNQAHLTETRYREKEFLLTHHLDQLANDPYYHRHLSLQEAYKIETSAVIDWDTRFHDRLKVLAMPIATGAGEYRITAPFRALQKSGAAQCCIVNPPGPGLIRIVNPIELARAAPDTVMVQQPMDEGQFAHMQGYRSYNKNVFVTYAMDDMLGNLPRKHYLHNYHAREGRARVRRGLSLADRAVVSTQPLADYITHMIDDIVVVPNRLERDIWLPHTSQRGTSSKPRVGWAGAQQHLGDLTLIKEVVEALASEVEWVFMGMCPDFLKPYVTEEHGFVNFRDYPAKLASLNLDLAIAPLEQLAFNEGKSNLRLLEYGIMGWPVVCTDVYPYQTNNAPVKRVNNVAAEWINAIRERIHDLDATYKEGDMLREWVLKHYILEDHLDDWLKAVTPR